MVKGKKDNFLALNIISVRIRLIFQQVFYYSSIFYQKSDPHLLQCHCFPTFLLANPNMPVEILSFAVISLYVFHGVTIRTRLYQNLNKKSNNQQEHLNKYNCIE